MQIIIDELHFNNKLVESLLYNYNKDLYKLTSELMMDWDELAELSNHPLSTIGLHGKRHIPYSFLNKTQISEDITESKTLLEKKIKCKVKHFAYPLGGKKYICGNGISDLKKNGIISAVTAVNGFLTEFELNNLTIIPRIEVSGNIGNNLYSYLDLQISGLLPYLDNLKKYIK